MTADLLAWFAGHFTPRERVWTALAPGLFIAAYFVVGFVMFNVRCLIWGVPRDAEIEARGRTVLVPYYFRFFILWLIRPLWRLILESGVPPNAITTLSALLALASGVAAAAGRFSLGGWLILFSGMLDMLDGRLARAKNATTRAGAAIDSILDRYSDAAVLVGLGWYWRGSWVLIGVLLALVGSSLVPYVRARGEALGVPVRGGMMQRPERILYLGVSMALSPILEVVYFPDDPHPMHWLAVGGVFLLALAANVTAVSRFAALVRALRDVPERKRPPWGRASLSAASSVIATGLDYLVVVALVEIAAFAPALATAVGAGLGAVVSFSLMRTLAFKSNGARAPQAGRYAFVSVVCLLLSSGGMALAGSFPVVSYLWAWWLVRASVFVLWSFPLQDSYVFPGAEAEAVGGSLAR